ncbi:peptidase T [Jeotgalibacillus malaysiensis]|uniref:Peptidase T n=1 Tax=Jeotgalibacillus malaysiensis TaxID=1508404 RepID=A0A0B5AVI6_9BACL|nr:peptidase T [Jeotgalibacillus malaysiensis]AJD92727.1 peptidase T [Jeotgalibacillus malaysiensis]
MQQKLMDRLITYAKIDTQSDPNSPSTPSTEKQWDLLRHLETELKEIGMEEVEVDDHGYLMATLPANIEGDIPTIGFLAHVDTATDFTGTNVNPQVVEYNGGDIQLNDKVTMSPAEFPELSKYKGHTLITTDGTTLLGADNKAGIAEIVTAMEHLIQNPDIKHGRIRIAFTPDEEIGRGPHKFNVKRFDADYAYTIDGGPIGELQYESFNAAGAKLTIHGTNVHPGTAKNKMVNSLKIAMELNQMLPLDEAPEFTAGYEGFFHLMQMNGDVEKTELQYIIRDHDRDKFEKRKSILQRVADEVNAKHGDGTVEITIEDQYYNMREKIEPVRHIVDIAEEAMNSLGIDAIIEPIRGGTDGSQLSYMGLPTPNVFTGGENFHGKFEYISVDNMEKASHVIVEIAKRFPHVDK